MEELCISNPNESEVHFVSSSDFSTSRSKTMRYSEPTASARLEQISAESQGRDDPTTRTTDLRAYSSSQIAATQAGQWEDRQKLLVDKFLDTLQQNWHFDNVKTAGLVFRDLSVAGSVRRCKAPYTLADAVGGTILRHILTYFRPKDAKPDSTMQPLVRNLTGVVGNGEMMLVLGRSGSGCTTLLKAITHRHDYGTSVTGHVSGAGRSSYCPEDDQHFPALTVRQTIEFSLKSSFPTGTTRQIRSLADALLKTFGMELSSDTLVGDQFRRGISGGERKRVSVMEALSLQSPVSAWDNVTCGLDANTALRLIHTLRLITDKTNRSVIVALHQVGDEIYDFFDKVLVLHDGRMLYQGPARDAQQYFESLGFSIKAGQTRSDFLTNVVTSSKSVHNCRRFAEILEQIFRDSKANEIVLAEVKSHEMEFATQPGRIGENTNETTKHQKYFVPSYRQQIINCMRREFWLKWGDWRRQGIKYLITVADGLVVASLYYNIPDNTAGLFSRSGATLFAALLLIWVQLCEVDETLASRPFLDRHRQHGFYRPSAAMFARFIIDWIVIPTLVVPWVIIIYFLGGFALDAGKFFTFLAFVWGLTLCVTALFRLLAVSSPSCDNAVRLAGIAHNVLLMFAGYTVTKPRLMAKRPLIGWIVYINPLAYGFEGMMSSQLHDLEIPCAREHLIPNEDEIGILPRTCIIPGTAYESTEVIGKEYLRIMFGYSATHLWRSFVVILLLTGVYLSGTWVTSEKIQHVHPPVRQRIVVETGQTRHPIADEESSGDGAAGESDCSHQADGLSTKRDGEKDVNDSTGMPDLSMTQPIEVSPPPASLDNSFAWKNINCTVKGRGIPPRQILTDLNGYVNRGVLMALVGPSGSGKTSLLHALSGRQTANSVVTGITTGSWWPANMDFCRCVGLVEQTSTLDETTTVREAFEFSAILRQRQSTSKGEKLRYVEYMLNALGLHNNANTTIESLDYAERKLVDIGYELVARPSLLVLMDEPISGLDAYAALSIIRVLRRLCDAGMTIICSVHQPSVDIIRHFDTIFALDLSGRCAYFGSTSGLRQYLTIRGMSYSNDAHAIAIIIDASIRRSTGGWVEDWYNSEERRALSATIQVLQDQEYRSMSENRQSFEIATESLVLQVRLLTVRLLLQYWRKPSYWYTWISVSLVSGLINGLCFWQVGKGLTSLQDRMFSVFLVILLPPIIVNAVKVRFYDNLPLWTRRELPAGTYDWKALCTACILAELPISTISASLYFVSWYLLSGISHEVSTGCYVFAMTLFYFYFIYSWAQWICMLLSDIEIMSNTLPFVFAVTGLCNGVVRPFSQLPRVWSTWLYWVNPTTWWIGGVLSATMGTLQIKCAEMELVHFDPPANTTCGQYTKNAAPGYLLDPDATSDCMYCPFATGAEYLASLDFDQQRKWLSLGLFTSFIVVNWLLFYFFTYVRHSKRLQHRREATILKIKRVAGALASLIQTT